MRNGFLMAPNKQASGLKGFGRCNERPNNKNGSRFKGSRRQQYRTQTVRHHFGCGICRADHRLVTCHKFEKMNLAEKYKTAITLHYCVNCLARNHLIGSCTSNARCQQCNGKHHTTLHGPQRIIKNLTQEPSPTPAPISAPTSVPRRSFKIAKVANPITTLMTKTFVPFLKI
ncbi:uncharacterized protein ACRADG_012796 [Cochliomyia hominivorax]